MLRLHGPDLTETPASGAPQTGAP
ncbi:MAG: hypothetical protein RIS48_2575, partial [Pseudomonadota bacterium]